MFNATTVTKAIESQLNSWSDLQDATVERSTRVNVYPSRMPWVGVYPGTVDTEPRVLASGSCRRWNETALPKLLLQAYDYGEEGQEASEALDELIEKVLECIVSDLTFGLSGVRLIGLNREYTYVQMDTDEEGELFFPQCEITLRFEIRS